MSQVFSSQAVCCSDHICQWMDLRAISCRANTSFCRMNLGSLRGEPQQAEHRKAMAAGSLPQWVGKMFTHEVQFAPRTLFPFLGFGVPGHREEGKGDAVGAPRKREHLAVGRRLSFSPVVRLKQCWGFAFRPSVIPLHLSRLQTRFKIHLKVIKIKRKKPHMLLLWNK